MAEEFRRTLGDDSLIDTVTGVMVNKYSPTVWGFANALTEVAQEFVEQRQMELERTAYLVTSCVAYGRPVKRSTFQRMCLSDFVS